MDIEIINRKIEVEAVANDRPVTVFVSGPPTLTVAVVGQQGPAGETPVPGPGFRLVGAELRYDFASLTRG